MSDTIEATEIFGDGVHDATRTVSESLRAGNASPSLTGSLLAAAREKLSGLEKFVQGAVVAPQGKAEIGSFMPLVRRMAAVGLVSTFAVLVPDSDAKAWGRPVGAGYGQSSIGAGFQAFRERRQEIRRERQNTALAAGAGLVGGLLLGGVLGNNNSNYGGGYRSYPPQQIRPAYPQAYGAGYGGGYGGGYGNPGGGYGRGGVVPSDSFTLAAKTLIASRIGSVEEADRIYDRFLRQAAACTAQLGPSAQCITRFQEISLDLGRGEFIAAADGQPVVVERQGQLNRIRPDILQGALIRSKEIKAAELYGRPGY